MSKSEVRDVINCSRCDSAQHKKLVFRRFKRPIIVGNGNAQTTFTHWAMCPILNQPILITLEDVPAEAVAA
jgi:hypothetical protein